MSNGNGERSFIVLLGPLSPNGIHGFTSTLKHCHELQTRSGLYCQSLSVLLRTELAERPRSFGGRSKATKVNWENTHERKTNYRDRFGSVTGRVYRIGAWNAESGSRES